jgi:hypothetical protein
MLTPNVVVQAIIAPPEEFGDTAKVLVRLSGAEQFIQVLSFYADEISFKADEVVGLTIDQVHELHNQKDRAWLQS